MTLILRIATHQAQDPQVVPEMRISSGEGTIGRGASSDWVLADPAVSSHHATVRLEGATWYLQDHSLNGTVANGQILHQDTCELRDGDLLVFGEYEVRVELEAQAGSDFGAAGLDEELLVPGGADYRSKDILDAFPPSRSAPDTGGAGGPAPGVGHSRASADSLDELLSNRDDLLESEPTDHRGGLGPDWEPGAGTVESGSAMESPWESPRLTPATGPASDVDAASQAPPHEQEERPYVETIDLGLGREAQRPDARPRAGQAAATPELPADIWDDLTGFGPPPPTPPDAPEPSPAPVAEPPPPTPTPEAVQPSTGPAPRPPVAPVSSPPAPDAPHPGPPAQQPRSAAKEPLRGQTGPPSMPAPAGLPGADALQVLLTAAGLDASRVPPDRAEQVMQIVGQIFREVIAGLVDVLQQRMQLKKEFRIEYTIMQRDENNPLKFSSDADDALENLLFRRRKGYLTPVQAVTEGFRDIRQHELAMVAGMSAAHKSLLEKFDPQALEEMFDDALKASTLMKKSKYWDLYCEMYQRLKDDDDLFGRAFSNAYERLMD